MSSPPSTGWNNEPELIELEPDEAGERKYKCSFCPNKIFKKRPEVTIQFINDIFLQQ